MFGVCVQYLYLDSEVWNSIKTLLWREFLVLLASMSGI